MLVCDPDVICKQSWPHSPYQTQWGQYALVPHASCCLLYEPDHASASHTMPLPLTQAYYLLLLLLPTSPHHPPPSVQAQHSSGVLKASNSVCQRSPSCHQMQARSTSAQQCCQN